MFLKPIIAHRGYSGIYPENTMLSFQKAIELGVKCIETDVTLIKDQKTAVLFHDFELDQRTDFKGTIDQLSLLDLPTVDAGIWKGNQFCGQKIPLLENLIIFAKKNNIVLNLELKGEAGKNEYLWENIVEITNALVQKHQFENNVFYSSFEIPMLRHLKKINSEAKFGLLLNHTNWENPAKELSANAIHMSGKVITEEITKNIKNAGYELYVYTVNEVNHANTLFTWGVDGIFTDYPNLFDNKLN